MDVAAFAAPTLRVRSVTRKLPPDSVFADGSSTELTTRSALAGVTCTVPADARQLLLSFVSGIAAVSSAHASR